MNIHNTPYARGSQETSPISGGTLVQVARRPDRPIHDLHAKAPGGTIATHDSTFVQLIS